MNKAKLENVGLSVRVHGEPAPQGSLKAFVRGGRAHLTADNNKTRPWKESVKWAVLDRVGSPMLDGPVECTIWFYLTKPPSVPKKRFVPWKKPDLDKLTRATWDGLTESGVWRDDAQVVSGHEYKRYATADEPPGAHIVITELES